MRSMKPEQWQSAALRAAKLLCGDLAGKLPVPLQGLDDDQRFLLWWVLGGRLEYPAASLEPPTEAECTWLFEPIAGWEPHGGLGMNRVLLVLLSTQAGLREAFDTSTPVGLWDAIAWFYLVGVRQLGIGAFAGKAVRAALNAPAYAATDGRPEQPSWLMVLAWRQVPALQKMFDIGAAPGRAGLVAWFGQCGMDQLGLQEWRRPAPALARAAATACSFDPARASFGVNLIGFGFGELGIGEDLRMAAEALQAADVPFKVFNLKAGPTSRHTDRLLSPHVVGSVAGLPYAINLFCLTGFDTLRALAEHGAALFAGRYNIGWWPWELPVWPRRWQQAFDVVDEIWAASRFTARAYAAAAGVPVVRMPLPVSIARLEKTSRRALGLPAKRFLFLYVFDFNSHLARKNPGAVIDAFQRAFPQGDNATGLVLKTMNGRPGHPAWKAFLRQCAADRRITLLPQTLDRPVVLGLVNACDAYVSLHRSEGFGRTLAEAMLLGKPVVGTGFSGNTDFLTADTGYPVRWTACAVAEGEYAHVQSDDKAWWAEPDITHAARQMRRARSAAGSEWALQLPRQVDAIFSPARIGRRMARLLRERFGRIA